MTQQGGLCSPGTAGTAVSSVDRTAITHIGKRQGSELVHDTKASEDVPSGKGLRVARRRKKTGTRSGWSRKVFQLGPVCSFRDSQREEVQRGNADQDRYRAL